MVTQKVSAIVGLAATGHYKYLGVVALSFPQPLGLLVLFCLALQRQTLLGNLLFSPLPLDPVLVESQSLVFSFHLLPTHLSEPRVLHPICGYFLQNFSNLFHAQLS